MDDIKLAFQTLQRGDTASAERLIHTILQRDRRNVEALILLGMIDAGRGRLEEAAHKFEQATQIQPNRADAHFNLGLLLAQLGRAPEAINSYNHAVRLEPAN